VANNRILQELDYTDRVNELMAQAEQDFTDKACKLYIDLVNAQLIKKDIQNYAILRHKLKNQI